MMGRARLDTIRGTVLCLLPLLIGAVELPAQRGQIPAGFTPLFNGEDLAGWHPSRTTHQGTTPDFAVEEGVLVLRQRPFGQGGVLLTDRSYRDFELYLEAMPGWGANGGIFFRSSESASAYQIELAGGNGATGDLIGEMLRVSKPVQATGIERVWREDEWNSFRLRVVGEVPQVTLWVNGTLMYDVVLERNDLIADASEGMIGLQVHWSATYAPGVASPQMERTMHHMWKPGAAHRLRNIAIREMGTAGNSREEGRGKREEEGTGNREQGTGKSNGTPLGLEGTGNREEKREKREQNAGGPSVVLPSPRIGGGDGGGGLRDGLRGGLRAGAPVPAERSGPHAGGSTFTNSLGMEFVRIEPGSMVVGRFQPTCPSPPPADSPPGAGLPQGRGWDARAAWTPDDYARCEELAERAYSPGFTVTIDRAYHIGRYEVSQAEWKAVMGTNPSVFQGSRVEGDADRHPVDNVSWEDAQAFIEGLNMLDSTGVYRLPTEFEWEYAARAGAEQDLTWDAIREQAWLQLADKGTTRPVGGKLPNGWGLHDLLGNVWEWVEDRYNEKTFADASPPDIGMVRVLRGGSFLSDVKNTTPVVRGAGPGNGFDVGFRVVREITSRPDPS